MKYSWAKDIQSTELLHYSRTERFNDDNKEKWFEIFNIKENMKILEVGCGSGHFLYMIKKYFPSCEVYGIDLDKDHIDFAKKWSEEKGVEINFSVADINKLPFEDNSFDLVFSHTVVEHLPFDNFIKEQKRVLNNDGEIIIMKIDSGHNHSNYYNFLNKELEEFSEKLEIKKEEITVGQYGKTPQEVMKELEKYSFKDASVEFKDIMYYYPDNENLDIAKRQIERKRQAHFYNELFILSFAKNRNEIENELLSLVDRKYDERLKLLNSGEKVYDYESTALIIIKAKNNKI